MSAASFSSALPLFLVHWFSKGARYTPAMRYALPYDASGQMQRFFPERNAPCLSVEAQQDVGASVTHLFFLRRPLAVCFAVWAIVVYALKSVIRGWPWPHVFVEHSEVIPTRIYLDAAPSIAMKERIGVIEATLSHGFPHRIFWNRFGHAMRTCWRGFHGSATAGRGVTSNQVAFHVFSNHAAGALTFDVGSPVPPKGRSQGGQLPETLSGKISHAGDHTIRRVSYLWA